MPVTFCSKLDRDARPSCKGPRCTNPSPACLERAGKIMNIGLINNMPDAALLATERQFVSLLESASPGINVRLHLFTMSGIPRGAAVASQVEQNYAGLDRMWDTQLDALIVTGREPSTANLTDEPYWEEFTRVVEWARHNTVSTIWSCLAAHATVLYLDKVVRRRSERKFTGVYPCSRVDDHPLLAGAPERLGLPHSRWNGLGEQDLRDTGYTILTRSDLASVDIFVKQLESLFVFFQGHPEYKANTLSLEYRRDVGRFLRGESAAWPSLPHNYFAPETAAALAALEQEATRSPREELAAELSSIVESARLEHAWRPVAGSLIGNWLGFIGEKKRLSVLASAAVAASSRRQAISGSQNWNLDFQHNRIQHSKQNALGWDMEAFPVQIAQADRQHQIHSLHHPIDLAEPVICVGGHGVMIRDINGREYIDGLSALWNVNVGHGRPELAEAAAEQMRQLAYFSGYAGSTTLPSIRLAERLIELAPHMAAVFFTSGGSEANESALKTARYYWKINGKPDKIKVIARIHGYHGVTLQTMSATGIAGYWKMFEPRVPGFLHVPTCYPYRHIPSASGEGAGEAAARELEAAILREGPDTVAAFIGEPIHGAGGVIYPTDDYWPRVREICHRYNVLLIADEIVTGFGRTGRWWGLQHWGVTPDIQSFAKGVTSGYLPLGGIMMSAKIRDVIESADPANRWMHGFTNSGHPPCCAVALKNIEILEKDGLLENSAKMGALLLKTLHDAFDDHPHAGDIRGGKGLIAAIEFVEDRATKKNFAPEKNVGARLKAEMKKRGVVTRTRPATEEHPAPGDQALFAPPLVISEAEVQRMVSVLRDAADVVFAG